MPHRARASAEGLVPFVAAGLLFGLLYNTLFYPRTLVEYVEAGTIGVLLGGLAGVAEQVLPSRWLQRLSLLEAVVARTLGYTAAGAVCLALVLSVEPAELGECSYGECVRQYVVGPLFLRDLAFTTVFAFFATFSAHVVLLVGTRNFGRLVTGRYRKPRELDAVFMFVDLRGSTGIAERLGHERYSAFLRDFFTDISGPIHQAKGEVYQYVGDEVVIVWPGRREASRWLQCFLDMRAAMEAERATYEARYGMLPEFKAGVHVGPVVVSEVGTLQRAHVYHGDVLNTAARLQAKCDETGFDLLVSEAGIDPLSPTQREGFMPVGAVSLRGRSGPVAVLGLKTSDLLP
jgi:adenylate cyclase